MKNRTIVSLLLTLSLIIMIGACTKSDSANVTTTIPTTPTTTSPADTTMTDSARLSIFKKIYGATDVYRDGDYVVIKTKCLPDHKSPYYKGTAWESALYEAYNGTGTFKQNPNTIAQQNVTFRIPLKPAEASTHTATPMGAMGVALNGVTFFNQYAAGGSPLTSEIVSFDQYGGHPQQQGMYHYHEEPFYITTNKGKDALLGFLLDGFPVYGPQENGKTLTSSDLDDYHGHFGKTTEYPNGIYHYHTSADAPYINGDGFYGTPGTVSQ